MPRQSFFQQGGAIVKNWILNFSKYFPIFKNFAPPSQTPDSDSRVNTVKTFTLVITGVARVQCPILQL
jgi:hypothetical protein